jgi:hypothetical protein
MTKLEGMTNDQMTNDRHIIFSSLVLRASFVIFFAFVLMLMARHTQAQSPNLIGKWKVEITFANEEHRSLRFEARSDGKGTLGLADPRSAAWGAAQPSEAKWSRSEGNAVTFSGPVEFLLGNVGRDAGTLVCKGKFETPDLITGEAEFSPLVGDRPSKHGTFKGVRAGG